MGISLQLSRRTGVTGFGRDEGREVDPRLPLDGEADPIFARFQELFQCRGLHVEGTLPLNLASKERVIKHKTSKCSDLLCMNPAPLLGPVEVKGAWPGPSSPHISYAGNFSWSNIFVVFMLWKNTTRSHLFWAKSPHENFPLYGS